ncbi:MAG TPA: nuclear transport factor 2 family protein [Rubrobacter sp.]|nr:nuclear transport factor 2 family protein [Rubrobacter sp.]
MTKQDDEGLDFGALRVGIERCDPDLLLSFYAEDARLSIVNAGASQASTFELYGKAEIAKHLRATFGQEASHRVERAEVVGEEDGLTFREVCEYPDGGLISVETTLEVRDGKIARQMDVVTSGARRNSQEGEEPETAELKYECCGGRYSAGPASVLKQGIEMED